MARHRTKRKEVAGNRGGAAPAVSAPLVPAENDWKKTAIMLAAILAITAIVYSISFQNGFTNWDDDKNVYENKYIHEINPANLKAYFTKPLIGMYSPLVYLSFALDYRILKLNPAIYHASNLLLHLMNIALVFILAGMMTGRREAAAAVSLIFAVHPLNVAAVAPVSVRSSLLYTLFFIAAFIFYIRYLRGGRTETKHLWAAFFLFLCSLLSKSAAVVFPPLMFLADYYYGRKINKEAVLEKLPFFALSLLFGVMTIIFREDAQHMGSSFAFAMADRLVLPSYALLFYVFKLVVPFNLSSYYPYPEKAGGVLPLYYYLAVPLLAAVGWAIIKVRKHRKEILFGTLFYLATIALVLRVFPMGNEMLCDRYAYLPSIGLLIAGAAILANEKELQVQMKLDIVKAVGAAGAAVVLLFAWLSYTRIPAWKDSFALYADMISHAGKVATAYNNRGIVYWLNKDYRKALADFDQAIALENSAADYLSNRGSVRTALQDYAGAMQDFNRSISITGKYPASYTGRCELKKEMGDFAGALQDCSKAIEIDPEYSIAWYRRALVYALVKDYGAALRDYSKAIELDPYRGGSAYFGRGFVEMAKGNLDAAQQDYTRALELEPQYVEALNNRGYVRFLLRDASGAMADFTRSIELSPGYHEAYFNRGIIKWSLNDRTGACTDWKTAAGLGRKDALRTIADNCK